MDAYYFDPYGWYTTEPLPGRATAIAPANLSQTTTPGDLRANFTGREWVELPYAAPPTTGLPVSAALATIDADTDAIYGAVLGNRAEEYMLAASEAQAYKAAGYTGAVPGSVQSWATAKGWTPAQAADDILLTAAQWTGAQAAIRAQRLLRKEQVRAATTLAGIDAPLAAWADFVAAIRATLGLS